MDEEYDVIVLGTGLTECFISGLLAAQGDKVLQLDRNGYYGSASPTLSLENLYEKFGKGAPDEEKTGNSRSWNVELAPKFFMANGDFTKLMIHTGVAQYCEFQSVEGSYIFKKEKIHPIPKTSTDALRSELFGFFQKRKFVKFLEYAAAYDKDDPTTHQGMDANTSMKAAFDHFGVDADGQCAVGHGLALNSDDEYLSKPHWETYDRIKLYTDSAIKYGSSPFMYPMYGLGELAQGFARLVSRLGGIMMLNIPIDAVEATEDGKVAVKSSDQTYVGKAVVGDPSYFPDRVQKVGQVVRAICLLSHPISAKMPLTSGNIIIPGAQASPPKKHDIYIACIGSGHQVAPASKWVAVASTQVETDNPEAELQAALALMGDVNEKFVDVVDLYEPKDDGKDSKIFVSKSYDGSSHLQGVSDDILSLYERLVGQPLDI